MILSIKGDLQDRVSMGEISTKIKLCLRIINLQC